MKRVVSGSTVAKRCIQEGQVRFWVLCFLAAFSNRSLADSFVPRCELQSEYGLGVNAQSVVRLPRKDFELSQFVVSWADAQDEETAIADRPVVGADVEVMRCLSSARWVSVGRGQVLRVRNGTVDAKIESLRGEWSGELSIEESKDRSVEGNFYLRPMVGDRIVPRTAEVGQKLALTPVERIPLSMLFSEQEISVGGKYLLGSLKEKFKNGNGRLLVEVESNSLGNRDTLRAASQLKANLIAQTLAVEWELNPDQVVALGRGSDGNRFGKREIPKWPLKESEENVVIKMIPLGN
jgi:hypothetical protein